MARRPGGNRAKLRTECELAQKNLCEAFRRRAVELPEFLEIDTQRKSVADAPGPGHHDLVGAGRTA